MVRYLFEQCNFNACIRMLCSYPGKRLNAEIFTLTQKQKPTLSRKRKNPVKALTLLYQCNTSLIDDQLISALIFSEAFLLLKSRLYC